MSCPVCRHADLQPLMTIRGYELVRCPACEAWHVPQAYLPRAPDGYGQGYLNRSEADAQTTSPRDTLSGYFDYEAELPLHLRNFQQHLGILKQHATGQKLLDVGCASGHFMLAAAQAGYDVSGIDVSPEAIAHVTAGLGFRAWAGDVLHLDMQERYDVITLWETIEHILRPAPVLRKLHGWLKPGGVLVIGTGDNSSLLARLMGKRWWYILPPDHVIYYNPFALTQVLADADFQVDDWQRIPYHWVSSRNITMKLLRSFQVNADTTLKLARRLPDVGLPVIHNTTMVAIAHQKTVRLGWNP